MNKNKAIKVYTAGHGCGTCGYDIWMGRTENVSKIENCDFVLGVGGSDVGNKYYGQPDCGRLSSWPDIDEREYKDFSRAIELGKPIVGICKGAQWGAALAGGAVFQDIHHPYHHEIKTFDGKILAFNSLHHNLADLSKLKENVDYSLLGWTENLSPYHINGYGENVPCEREPEVFILHKVKWLGFQNHNEMLYRTKYFEDTIQWSRKILVDFLNKYS